MSAMTRLRGLLVEEQRTAEASDPAWNAYEAALALIDTFIEAESVDPAACVPDAVEQFYKAVKERSLEYLTTRAGGGTQPWAGAADVLAALDAEITDYRRRR